MSIVGPGTGFFRKQVFVRPTYSLCKSFCFLTFTNPPSGLFDTEKPHGYAPYAVEFGTVAPTLPYEWVPDVLGNLPEGVELMSRIRHLLKSFALLACLAFLFFSFGCSGDSVVAPADGPGGVTTESDYDGINSAPDGPNFAQGGQVGG